MCNNVRGVKSKIVSIKEIIEEEKPTIIGLVETKLNKEDIVEIKGYKTMRVDRETEGGGVLLAYKECLDNKIVITREEREMCEMLWVKIANGRCKIRVGIVYMPQETISKKDMKRIYDIMEEEIKAATENNEKVLLMGDLNCKVGEHIKGNTQVVTKGGKLLLKLINKYNLSIANNEECCKGLWTRVEGTEKSVIDYIIIRKEDTQYMSEMIVDEEKECTPYTTETIEGKSQIKYTDHNMMVAKVDWILSLKEPNNCFARINPGKAEEFAKELEVKEVSKIIKEEEFNETYRKWSERIVEIGSKFYCKKVKKKEWKVDRKLKQAKRRVIKELRKKDLLKEEIKVLKEKKKLILEHIESEHVNRNIKKTEKIVEAIKHQGGVDSTTFWIAKKKLMGKQIESAHIIIDENGVKQEDENKIKEVYKRYYENLLSTKAGETDEERKTEEVVAHVMEMMEKMSAIMEPRKTTTKEVEDVVKSLDIKKSKDMRNWSNDMVEKGGEEITKSLVKIFNIMDEKLDTPKEWESMEIVSINKKGSKLLMTNKRGLFLTNIISKIYERVLKERNKDEIKKGMSEWQMGGIKNRSTIDNIMIIMSIVERNKYLGKNTYIFYADAEKCFDRLWLDDGIAELWRCGMNMRDAIMVRKMNQRAVITIRTPVGNTEELIVENIVRQGTVYGPQICGVSMDRINSTGKDIITHYGPELVLRAPIFVDDITSAGSCATVNNAISNCNMLETRKKMTFNTKNGKTEYSVVTVNKDIQSVTSQVKRGEVRRTKEHKALGIWIDEKGGYEINIRKNKTKIPHMIAVVKAWACNGKIGTIAVEGRLKLAETIIIPSIIYNIEGFPKITGKEVEELEKIQGQVLKEMLEIPKTTPYCGVLMETGFITMGARIAYKKLMLFHNIMNSEDERVTKKLIKIQMDDDRDGTWYDDVKKYKEKYEIKMKVTETIKSKWKKEVKQQIRKHTEKEIRTRCNEMKKTRTVKDDVYEMKQYLKNNTVNEVKGIMMTRLHMTKLECNYQSSKNSTKCPLCGKESDEGINTEHYFGCSATVHLARIWETEEDDIRSNEVEELRRAKNFIEKVEQIMELKNE